MRKRPRMSISYEAAALARPMRVPPSTARMLLTSIALFLTGKEWGRELECQAEAPFLPAPILAHQPHTFPATER